MSDPLISYAKISAEWLRGMKFHIKHGTPDWVVGRSIAAAQELEDCIAEITRLRALKESPNADR